MHRRIFRPINHPPIRPHPPPEKTPKTTLEQQSRTCRAVTKPDRRVCQQAVFR